ncbi:ATP synthase subunit O, mitochondrial-like [Senna tora]|uniref:ATP synthase subunit O, mitochondrial-like n=1 Tax=Senna tora TaxID=362788 RepID=A0A834TPE5_9FABA|nr:ATP synthase subunit O, mitochondrial-like [Senna tora]
MATRNYATATGQKEQKVKVPLALFGGSGNYATALYIAAVKANSLQKVETEILDLVEATKRSPKFLEFTKDLSVPKDTRIKAIKAVCGDAKFSDITKNFLVSTKLLASVLAENGRLRNLETIAKRFVQLTMAHKGEVKAIVTTVTKCFKGVLEPLPPQEEKELKETIQAIIGAGKTVLLEQKIDPSILGGLLVEFDQKVFDMSIKTRAIQMERFLRDPVNIANI